MYFFSSQFNAGYSDNALKFLFNINHSGIDMVKKIILFYNIMFKLNY